MMVFWRLWVSKMLGMALSCYLQKAMELALLRFATAYLILLAVFSPIHILDHYLLYFTPSTPNMRHALLSVDRWI